MHLAPALCILLLITAWYAPVLADEPAPDYDALILAGLENQTVTDEIERVLQDEDALLSFEPACCLAEEQMAGVSHSTYERIKQTYATDERVNNLMEQHVKRDSVVDLTFRGMPFESEAWLVRLIVTIVVIVIIIVVVVAAHYATPALAPAVAEVPAEVPTLGGAGWGIPTNTTERGEERFRIFLHLKKVLHRSKNLTGFIRYQANSRRIISYVACNTFNYAGLAGLLSLLNTDSNDNLRAGSIQPHKPVFAVKYVQPRGITLLMSHIRLFFHFF